MPKISKLRYLNLSEKADVLCAYDKLPKVSLRKAAMQLNVSHCTLSRLLKDRSNVERAPLENEDLTRRRQRTGKEELVEVVLKEWFLKV